MKFAHAILCLAISGQTSAQDVFEQEIADKVKALGGSVEWTLATSPIILRINLVEKDADDDLVESFEKLSGLSELYISGPKITDRAMKSISRCRDLTRLCIAYSKVTGEGLRRLSGNDKLSSLTLGPDEVDDGMFAAAGSLKQLKELSLYFSDDISELPAPKGMWDFSEMENLKSVTISGRRFDDQRLRAIAQCANIHTLWITGASITDIGFAKVVKQMKKLMYVHFSRCEIGDETFREMSRELPTLFSVRAHSCNVSERAARDLRAAHPACSVAVKTKKKPL